MSFYVADRYSLICSIDGRIENTFDSGKEEEMYQELKGMKKRGFCMSTMFITDANNGFSAMPALVWCRLRKYHEIA